MNTYSRAEERPIFGLVTVDTEPDNVWHDHRSHTFENIKYLHRFHQICSNFGIRPTYLVTYSVATDRESSKIVEALLCTDNCEIGVHSHLWEVPPVTASDVEAACIGNQYDNGMLGEKLSNLVFTLSSRFGEAISHRAGRWGFDERQVKILTSLGIRVDTSVTPGLSWSMVGGPDFSGAAVSAHWLDSKGPQRILEVPCTIRPGLNMGRLTSNRYVQRVLSRTPFGPGWLRCVPHITTDRLISICRWGAACTGCLNLMTHSSELAPSTSPMWQSESDIDRHLSLYAAIFTWWNANNIIPATLSEFVASWPGPEFPSQTGASI